MPKGYHYGHIQTRSYIEGYKRLYANQFKQLLGYEDNEYQFELEGVTDAHRRFKLTTTIEYPKVMIFSFPDQRVPIPLVKQSVSVSTKVYFVCPYCVKNRQYLLITNNTFICRQCLGVNYACQSESKSDRKMRRIRKLRRQLWGDTAFVYSLFDSSEHFTKPKGKQWRTFIRKQAEVVNLENDYWKDFLKSNLYKSHVKFDVLP